VVCPGKAKPYFHSSIMVSARKGMPGKAMLRRVSQVLVLESKSIPRKGICPGIVFKS